MAQYLFEEARAVSKNEKDQSDNVSKLINKQTTSTMESPIFMALNQKLHRDVPQAHRIAMVNLLLS